MWYLYRNDSTCGYINIYTHAHSIIRLVDNIINNMNNYVVNIILYIWYSCFCIDKINIDTCLESYNEVINPHYVYLIIKVVRVLSYIVISVVKYPSCQNNALYRLDLWAIVSGGDRYQWENLAIIGQKVTDGVIYYIE